MAISERMRTDPAIASRLATKPAIVSITLVRRADNLGGTPLLYRLTKKTSENYVEEAERMGYVPVAFVGPLDEIAGKTPSAKGLALMVADNDQLMLAIETLLNATSRPMFLLGDQTGQARGHDEGLAAGDATGYQRGKTDGLTEGNAAGYDLGYAAGHVAGVVAGKIHGVEVMQRHLTLLFNADPTVLVATIDPSTREVNPPVAPRVHDGAA